MRHLEDLKEAACKELERFAKSGEITASNLDKIHKLTDIVKNIDKIDALEESGYSADWIAGGKMNDGTSSYARRAYPHRDSMGRYSRESSAKDTMLKRLGEMMEDADPNEREALKKAMREIEMA